MAVSASWVCVVPRASARKASGARPAPTRAVERAAPAAMGASAVDAAASARAAPRAASANVSLMKMEVLVEVAQAARSAATVDSAASRLLESLSATAHRSGRVQGARNMIPGSEAARHPRRWRAFTTCSSSHLKRKRNCVVLGAVKRRLGTATVMRNATPMRATLMVETALLVSGGKLLPLFLQTHLKLAYVFGMNA